MHVGGGFKSNVLMLGDVTIPEVDLEGAGKEFQMLPGRAVVEMSPWREKQGAIYLPEVAYDRNFISTRNSQGAYKVQGRYRPNVGVMLADVKDRDGSLGAYRAGDVVLVRPYDGIILPAYNGKHFSTENEVRMYGIAQDFDLEKSVAWDVYDQIVGWYDWGDIIPGPGYTKISRLKKNFDVLVSCDIWADEGIGLAGTYADSHIHFEEGHPDDILHLEFTDTTDIWLVPDRCVLLEQT